MILLTKLDGARILVGLETIKYIEETPDTLLRFLNGESVIVKETLEQICERVDCMRRRAAADSFEVSDNRVTAKGVDATPQ